VIGFDRDIRPPAVRGRIETRATGECTKISPMGAARKHGEDSCRHVNCSKPAVRLPSVSPTAPSRLYSRFALASTFWRSAQTKVTGFSIREETFDLFRDEYKVPLLPPDLAAYLATIGEHAFSVLLLVGLASRLSALGLFGMTMVIQLFVFPDGWPEHILWVALQLLIISRGPGAISLDHLIWTRVPGVAIIAH
jgi:putative oxidoreductase